MPVLQIHVNSNGFASAIVVGSINLKKKTYQSRPANQAMEPAIYKATRPTISSHNEY